MTGRERTDDSGRLQIPFPPDDPEAPPPGTASGRSRLSDRRPPDPDAGPETARGQRPARLTGARHRPGHAIGRSAAGSSTGSGGAERESDPSGRNPGPSNGATASPPVVEPDDAASKDPGGSDGLASSPPDTPAEATEPGPSSEAVSNGAGPNAPEADHDVPPTRFGAAAGATTAAAAAAGASMAALAGRVKQIRLPKRTTPPAPAGTVDAADPMFGAPVPADAVAPDPTRAASSPAPERAPSGLRRSGRRPDLSGLQEMRAGTKSGRVPDWMARRIAESEAPGAAYELGKPRRLRRRKITVLRSRTDRRLIRRIDTWTVFKVSFMFYLLMVIIVLIAGIATWNVAEHLGFIGDIQKSVRSLADDKSFVFHGEAALRWAAVGGAALGLLGTLFNTVAAMLYNLLSDVIGGLQVVVVTEAD